MMKQLSPVLAAGRERLSEYWSCKVWLRPLTRGLWGLLVVVRTSLGHSNHCPRHNILERHFLDNTRPRNRLAVGLHEINNNFAIARPEQTGRKFKDAIECRRVQTAPTFLEPYPPKAPRCSAPGMHCPAVEAV